MIKNYYIWHNKYNNFRKTFKKFEEILSDENTRECWMFFPDSKHSFISVLFPIYIQIIERLLLRRQVIVLFEYFFNLCLEQSTKIVFSFEIHLQLSYGQRTNTKQQTPSFESSTPSFRYRGRLLFYQHPGCCDNHKKYGS